jgi:hypothetical protein
MEETMAPTLNNQEMVMERVAEKHLRATEALLDLAVSIAQGLRAEGYDVPGEVQRLESIVAEPDTSSGSCAHFPIFSSWRNRRWRPTMLWTMTRSKRY